MTGPFSIAINRVFHILKWVGVRENLMFGVLIAALLIPVWSFTYFPSQDGPSHLNNANILFQYDHPDQTVLREYFDFNESPAPNWSGYLILAALMSLFPPLIAEKLLLSGYVILLPLSIRYAIRAIKPENAGLAILSLPFVYNYLLHMGFYNFSLSLAVSFFLIGYWAKHQTRFALRETITLAVLSLTLYFSSIFSVFAAHAAIGVLAAAFTFIEIRQWMRGETVNIRDGIRSRICLPLLAFVPTALLTLDYLLDRGLAHDGRPWAPLQLLRLYSLETLVSHDSREELLASAVFFLFAATTIYLLILKLVRRDWNRWDALLGLSLAYTVAYVVSPDTVSEHGAFISARLMLMPFFALILWFGAQRLHAYAKLATQVGAAIIALLFLSVNMQSYSRLNEYLADYTAGMELIEPNSTLLPLSFAHNGIDEDKEALSKRIGVFQHAAGHIAAQRHVVDMANFAADEGVFPIVFRPERNPYSHMGLIESRPPELDFLSFHEKTGGTVDYVLVWQLSDIDNEPTRHILKQLEDGYELIFTSPRGFADLYRRKDSSRPE